MARKCLVFFFVLGAIGAAAAYELRQDEMAPGIRARVTSSHYPERQRPVRVPMSTSTHAVPINFSPHSGGITPARPHGTSSLDAPSYRTTNSIDLRNDVMHVNPEDRTLPAIPNDRWRPTAPGGNKPTSALEMNFDEMNVDAMLTMSRVSTVEEFARLMGVELPPEVAYVMPPVSNNSPDIAPRFGLESAEPRVPTSAGCQSELQVVPLALEAELGVMHFPTCVRLPRCGGCCPGTLLQCRPTQVKPVTLKILRVKQEVPEGRSAPVDVPEGRSRRRRPQTANSRRRRGTSTSYEMVEQEEHIACSCQCRVQEQDCNPHTHDYVRSDCQCTCKNQDERVKCEEKTFTHFWDGEACACLCHSSHRCSTGHYFDHNTCSCSSIAVRGRSGASVAQPVDGLPRRPAQRVPVVFDPTWGANAYNPHQPPLTPHNVQLYPTW